MSCEYIHTELVVRLLGAVLTPSAELDVLVESRALAQGVRILRAARLRRRNQSHRQLRQARRLTGECRCSSKTTAAAACARCSRRCAARAARSFTCWAPAWTTFKKDRRRLRDDFPEVTTPDARRARRATAPDRARPLGHPPARPAVSALHQTMPIGVDPDAQRSGSRRDGQWPGASDNLRRTKQTAVIGCLEPVTRPENLRMVKLLE